MCIDEASHILHDEDYQMKYETDLKSTVLRAKARPNSLLKGYDICIGPHVQLPFTASSAIIYSAGGNVKFLQVSAFTTTSFPTFESKTYVIFFFLWGLCQVIRGVEKVKEASKAIYIGCEEDTMEALSAVKKGVRTFSSDWLMNCVMKQQLELEASQFVESL